MIDEWIAALYRASWEGSLCILLAWWICRRRLLSPQACCWLWRLVFVKLLLALFWRAPVPVPILPGEMVRAQQEAAPRLSAAPAPARSVHAPALAPASLSLPPASTRLAPRLLFWLWLAGAAAGSARLVARQRRAGRFRIAGHPIDDVDLLRTP